jgi:hypothetical protein
MLSGFSPDRGKLGTKLASIFSKRTNLILPHFSKSKDGLASLFALLSAKGLP